MVLAGDDPGLDLDEDLDRIAGGALAWRGMLEGFWSGFHPALEKAGALERAAVLQAVEDRLHGFLFADLLEAGFSLERALSIAAQVAKDQGQRARAQLLLSWRRALLEDRFAETAADALPASEAMIFHAYGRVDAGVLFAARRAGGGDARPPALGGMEGIGPCRWCWRRAWCCCSGRRGATSFP